MHVSIQSIHPLMGCLVYAIDMATLVVALQVVVQMQHPLVLSIKVQ